MKKELWNFATGFVPRKEANLNEVLWGLGPPPFFWGKG